MDNLIEYPKLPLFTGGDLPSYLATLTAELDRHLAEITQRVNWLLRVPYGEISVTGNATATTISVAGTDVQVTVFDTNGHSQLTTPDHTNDHIEIEVSGHYVVLVSASIDSVAGPGSTMEVTVKKNNGAEEIIPNVERSLGGGGGETGVISLSGFCELDVGDTVELWVSNSTGTENYVFEDVSLAVVRLGDM